jgi:hypothetical protein
MSVTLKLKCINLLWSHVDVQLAEKGQINMEDLVYMLVYFYLGWQEQIQRGVSLLSLENMASYKISSQYDLSNSLTNTSEEEVVIYRAGQCILKIKSEPQA